MPGSLFPLSSKCFIFTFIPHLWTGNMTFLIQGLSFPPLLSGTVLRSPDSLPQQRALQHPEPDPLSSTLSYPKRVYHLPDIRVPDTSILGAQKHENQSRQITGATMRPAAKSAAAPMVGRPQPQEGTHAQF